MGSQLAHPQKIALATPWDLFTTTPPSVIEQEAFPEVRSNLAPQGEIILAISEDMTLAHINKTYALPSGYVPPNLNKITGVPTFREQYLREDTLPYLYQLFGAAAEAGFRLSVLSAYRSYFVQETTFSWWVKQTGWEAAARGSAFPGHSEHQLGTTVDLALDQPDFQTFSQSPVAAWVAKNAARFGFIVSYQEGKERITGYIYEPWHIRFVGVDLATKLYREGNTLEEYFRKNTLGEAHR
ncbi:MAG: M15 family metallopeptidase [Patescibacteria group bacterium]|nr:MAG: M15 family metallopeptidase [Patescibacteria group bacterium]